MQKEGLLYNPVNMKIEDEKRLQEKDIREKKKKQRFEIRYEVENDLRVKGIEELEKTKLQKLNRVNYRRYVEHLDRGFDILTNDQFDSPEMQKKLYKPQVAEKPKVWDIIEGQRNASQPQTPNTVPAEYQKPVSKHGNESDSENQNSQPVQPLVPSSKRSQGEPHSRRHSDAPPAPQSKRILPPLEKPQSKNMAAAVVPVVPAPPQSKHVLSQAGAEHVASRSATSTRSIRTGAFQGVPIKH